MSAGRWISCPVPRPQARVVLYCLPHAGAGAGVFRDWGRRLPASVEVRGVQPPGRENRLMETPIPSAPALAEAAAEALAPWDRPFALFGHSMGALVAFELARSLRRRGLPGPAVLLAAAYRAPQLGRDDVAIPDALSDDAFLEEVDRRYGAVPQEVRHNRELLELLLPGLRADIAVCDTYAYAPEPPLCCPIHAFGGTGDATVSRAELEAWKAQTSARFDLTLFPGDHFFLQNAAASLLAVVAAELARLEDPGGTTP